MPLSYNVFLSVIYIDFSAGGCLGFSGVLNMALKVSFKASFQPVLSQRLYCLYQFLRLPPAVQPFLLFSRLVVKWVLNMPSLSKYQKSSHGYLDG